jgi:hypothetical protein
MTTRHYSQTTDGLTRTVTCVDHVGPDAVLLFTEFDMHDRLLKQVRFEHLRGMLANALFTRFGPGGKVEEQWVFLYDEKGNVTDYFGFDEDGRALKAHPPKLQVC